MGANWVEPSNVRVNPYILHVSIKKNGGGGQTKNKQTLAVLVLNVN